MLPSTAFLPVTHHYRLMLFLAGYFILTLTLNYNTSLVTDLVLYNLEDKAVLANIVFENLAKHSVLRETQLSIFSKLVDSEVISDFVCNVLDESALFTGLNPVSLPTLTINFISSSTA